MRLKWAIVVVALCVVVAVAAVAYAAGKASEGSAPEAVQQRPTERVSPAPEVNPNAVVWRTPEPPTHPQAGDVWINPKGGMAMVCVPAGDFILGTSDAQIDAWLEEYPDDTREMFRDEQPQCQVDLPAYWIGRTEVSNAHCLRFVTATGQRAPQHWGSGGPPDGLEDFPVVNITWQDAVSYCAWAGGRLPTELEWEKAAQGTDGRIFPWWNEWDANRCRNFEAVAGRSHPTVMAWALALHDWVGANDLFREGHAAVGSYPAGASPYGCQGMAGNVEEWCEDRYDRDAYRRYAGGDLKLPLDGEQKVLRGGTWDIESPLHFRCADRYSLSPGLRYNNIGFRCARDAMPGSEASPAHE